MLFALAQPASLAGLVAAFVVALLIRAVVVGLLRRRVERAPVLHVRRDVDVFGVVAAALGGTGWGRGQADVGAGPPPLAALLAGPAAVLTASQAAFALYRAASGSPTLLAAYGTADVLRGVPGGLGGVASQVLLSFAVGLLAFGVLALVPLPPLDGWGLLRRAVRRPGTGFAKARYWLEDQNVGIVLLLVGMIVPLGRGTPLLLAVLDAVTTPVLRAWA